MKYLQCKHCREQGFRLEDSAKYVYAICITCRTTSFKFKKDIDKILKFKK